MEMYSDQDNDAEDVVLDDFNEKWTPIKLDVLSFKLNGKVKTVATSNITPEMTLNEYLRNQMHLTGTKYMCFEGGCGACIVSATITNPRTNNKETKAVNSCLVALLSCQNWEINTIEYLGNQNDGLNKIQSNIVKYNGTQCGFCTPGMIMNMYALQENDKTKMAEIENSFGSNICRCTGYRSILSAFKSMASDAKPSMPDIEELRLCSKDNKTVCQTACVEKCDQLLRIDLPVEMNLQGNSIDLIDLTESQNWYKVKTTKEIFKLFRNNRGKSYQLVAGNTARGVYRDISQKEYFIDISDVKELKNYQLNTRSLVLGGNMTLNEVMNVFYEIAAKDDDFKYLLKFAEHFDLVAHVAVRNIGTLAGNLSIKYEHNEFPSDIFLLLEVIDAKIVVASSSSTLVRKKKMSPKQYLDFNMKEKIIHSIELPPLDDSYKLETYKIMPRAQNAHAYLNAAFLISFNKKNVVSSASFVFGGINPDFIHAEKAEKYIKGKELFNNNNMQTLFDTLQSELNPDNVSPDPSPEFRNQLGVALMYKYILSLAPEGVVSKQNKTGSGKLIRAKVSSGVQEYKTDKANYPIGEDIRKLEAPIQATGEAEYITDMLDSPDQCFAAFVLGKAKPGSVLKKIDTSEVMKMEGVEGFFQATDIDELGGVNSFLAPNPLFGHEAEEIFLPIGQPIKFYYEPVGVIVANTRRLAQKAAGLVKVSFESSTQPVVLTTKQAIEADKQTKDESKKRVQHIESRLPKNQTKEPSIKFQGCFECAWKYHYHMELQVVNVVPGDDGYFDIYPSTQWMESVQTSIQRALNIPANKLRIAVKRLGGSFGAKITRNNWTSVAATLAALKLRKPVKFMIPLTDNMNIMGKRNNYRSEYDVGVDNDGVIINLTNKLYNNVGVYRNAMLEGFVLELYEGTYVKDYFETDTYSVRTDNPAATMMRAPGSFEGCGVIENIVEHIAYKVNKDPIDVRLANLNEKDNPLLKKLIDDCLTWSDYRKRRADIENFNKENRWRKKGIAIIPMTYGLLFNGPYNVQVTIFQADGTVAISHCGVEMGQGINTKTTQAAAHLLNIDISMIKVWPTNNFTSPNNFATGGAVTTESVIFALKSACTNLLTNINKAATTAKLPENASWLEKVQAAYTNGVNLTENQMFSNDFSNPDKFITYKVYGVCVSEVEVDILTGSHIVQRVDLLEDVGDSLNPIIDIGQCEGAFVLGMGNWTIENIVLDDDGALKTNSTWWYKVPGAKDIPVDFRVKLPDGIPNPVTPFHNKATSEPPICLSFSVPLAIKHALKSARLQSDEKADPWATMEGPTTIEWIFNNSFNDLKQYKL